MPSCWNSQDVSLAPLQPGPGLGVIDVEPAAGLPAGPDDAQSGAETRRCQRPGVAVGQHALAVGRHQGAAVLADAAVDSLVLFLDATGLCLQPRQDAAGIRFRLGDAQHPAHGPAQVDGGGTGSGDVGSGLPQRADEVVTLAGLQFGGGQHHGVGRGDADGRRAPHAHIGDGGGGNAIVSNADGGMLVGQEGLVNQFQPAAGPVDWTNFGHKQAAVSFVVRFRGRCNAATDRRSGYSGSS